MSELAFSLAVEMPDEAELILLPPLLEDCILKITAKVPLIAIAAIPAIIARFLLFIVLNELRIII